jgi:O-6-methylguanine DNA methyltransferase
MTFFTMTIDSPLGPMRAIANERALCGLETLALSERCERMHAKLARAFDGARFEESPAHETLRLAAAELAKYFDGDLVALARIPVSPAGTAFERRVWDELLRIPAGETRTYAALARAIGAPNATRAVGRANGANSIAIVIPCHRVIASDGSLCGYAGGLEMKRWLLEHEGARDRSLDFGAARSAAVRADASPAVAR